MELDREYVKAQRLLVERARVSGDENELATSMYDLGMHFDQCGMFPLAISILGEACQFYKRLLPPDDPRTLLSVASLAAAHFKKGNVSDAQKLFDEVLAAKGRALGCWDYGNRDDRPGYDQANLAAVYIVRNKCVIRF